jgi:RNA polymerase sigma-70 factor (ECF subfamily)
MESAPDARTSSTLLARLRQAPVDQAAWSAFVERYGRQIYRWCRQWGLQEADTQDVTQDVLLKLAAKIRTFTYDPAKSFRAWLKKLTRHAWSDFLAAQRRPGQGSGDSEVLRCLDSVQAREDLIQQLEEAFDLELLDEAMARVQLRVEPHTWEAFRLLAFEGWSGAQAAEKLQMKVATVFVARSKVQKMLLEVLQQLDRTEPEGEEESS